MPEQFWLPGLAPQPVTSDHWFLAVLPPPEVAAEVVRRARDVRVAEGLRGRLITQGCLHVTLHAVPQSHLVGARRAAVTAVEAPPFEIVFDCMMSFERTAGGRPVVLRASGALAELEVFHGRLGSALRGAGFRRKPASGFTPHMTLLYDRRLVRPRTVAPVRWMVREVVLVHSLVGQGRHEHLDRWPLRG
jgi:2'-5' RNA ligase